jgi:hypothetical protein
LTSGAAEMRTTRTAERRRNIQWLVDSIRPSILSRNWKQKTPSSENPCSAFKARDRYTQLWFVPCFKYESHGCSSTFINLLNYIFSGSRRNQIEVSTNHRVLSLSCDLHFLSSSDDVWIVLVILIGIIPYVPSFQSSNFDHLSANRSGRKMPGMMESM